MCCSPVWWALDQQIWRLSSISSMDSAVWLLQATMSYSWTLELDRRAGV